MSDSHQKEPVVSAFLEYGKNASFDEDAFLAERFLAGDSGAFSELYERFYDKVYAIARGVLIDSDEAADVTQEIFTLLYRNLTKFDHRSKLSTWIFRVAVNRSIQQARSGKWRKRSVPLTEAAEQPYYDSHRETPDPKISRALAKMSVNDRALLTLFYWEELSLQEIADSIGCNVNAAKTRLFRARERFKTLYEDEL